MSEESLDDILNGTDDDVAEAAEVVATPAPEAEQPVKELAPEEDKPSETTGEHAATPVAKDETDWKAEAERLRRETEGTMSALKAEREKRQRLEQLQQSAEKPERPDPYEDPDGAAAFDRTQFEQALLNNKVEVSIALSEATITDFSEVMGKDDDGNFAAWEAYRVKNPHVVQAMLASPNPAQFAYNVLKRERIAEEIGDPVAYREKMRAQIEQELRAELEAKAAQTSNVSADIPETLAGEQSVGSRKVVDDLDADQPMNALLGG